MVAGGDRLGGNGRLRGGHNLVKECGRDGEDGGYETCKTTEPLREDIHLVGS